MSTVSTYFVSARFSTPLPSAWQIAFLPQSSPTHFGACILPGPSLAEVPSPALLVWWRAAFASGGESTVTREPREAERIHETSHHLAAKRLSSRARTHGSQLQSGVARAKNPVRESTMTASKTFFKKSANRWLAKRGMEIVHQRLEYSPTTQLMLTMKRFDVNLVIDVGANIGQFASELFDRGYQGEIISIEPLPAAHSTLNEAALSNPKWTVREPLAAGPDEKMVEIMIAGNSFSSSILPMLDRHVKAAPAAATVGSVMVQQRRLDAILGSRITNRDRVLLKIDTQGYEKSVLDGAPATLEQVRVVLLEMSLQPLYRDQSLWLELIEYMNTRGFKLWGLQPEFSDPQTGQTLQVNGIFCRDGR
jgi:FkbM family methyltransferase